MKNFLICLVIAFFVLFQTANREHALAQGIEAEGLKIIATGMAVDKAIEEIDEILTEKLSLAIGGGNYLAEKVALQGDALLSNLKYLVGDASDRVVDDLSGMERELLFGLDRLAAKLETGVIEAMAIEEFFSMNLADIADSFPFVESSELFFARMDGYSQVYSRGGVYSVVVRGRAFKERADIKLHLNLVPRPDEVRSGGDGNDASKIEISAFQRITIEARPSRKENERTFIIPSNEINHLFLDGEIARIPVTIVSEFGEKNEGCLLFCKRQNRSLSFESEILLLPKNPVKYDFVQVEQNDGWSSDIVDRARGTTIATATGKSGRWRPFTVCATIPDGTLMVPATAESKVIQGVGPGDWGHYSSGFSYDLPDANGPTRVCRNFDHQIHDQNRTLEMSVGYREPVKVHGRKPIDLQDPITEVAQTKPLEFGELYTAQLDADKTQTYFIRLYYFNGFTVTLSEGDVKKDNEFVDLDEVSNANYRSVSLRLKAPASFVE